jgi:hypothetical protein
LAPPEKVPLILQARIWIQQQLGREDLTLVKDFLKSIRYDSAAPLSTWQVLGTDSSLTDCLKRRDHELQMADDDVRRSLSQQGTLDRFLEATKREKMDEKTKELVNLAREIERVAGAFTPLNRARIADSRCIPTDAVKLK